MLRLSTAGNYLLMVVIRNGPSVNPRASKSVNPHL